MRLLFLTISALGLAGCATPIDHGNAMTVAEFREAAQSLIDQEITLVGYVGPCVPLSCAIADKPDVWGVNSNQVSIGRAPAFDRKVAHFAGQRVRIKATFTGRCFDFDPNDDVISICADRGSTLSEPSFLGPANSKE